MSKKAEVFGEIDTAYLGEMPLGVEVDGDWEEAQELAEINREIEMDRRDKDWDVLDQWEEFEAVLKLRPLTAKEERGQAACIEHFGSLTQLLRELGRREEFRKERIKK